MPIDVNWLLNTPLEELRRQLDASIPVKPVISEAQLVKTLRELTPDIIRIYRKHSGAK
jgi:hypothetical protein